MVYHRRMLTQTILILATGETDVRLLGSGIYPITSVSHRLLTLVLCVDTITRIRLLVGYPFSRRTRTSGDVRISIKRTFFELVAFGLWNVRNGVLWGFRKGGRTSVLGQFARFLVLVPSRRLNDGSNVRRSSQTGPQVGRMAVDHTLFG